MVTFTYLEFVHVTLLETSLQISSGQMRLYWTGGGSTPRAISRSCEDKGIIVNKAVQ